MLSRLLLALVGMAMGGLAGLLLDFLGLGNAAVLAGALIGSVVFVWAVPRLNRTPPSH